jgi:hypothetical protein
MAVELSLEGGDQIVSRLVMVVYGLTFKVKQTLPATRNSIEIPKDQG